jgi:riboflavin synthase
MFTGLIEEIGSLRRIHRQGQAMVLTIAAKHIMDDVRLGDSIAVNGVCLTVIAFDSSSFTVDVMPETFRHTNLSSLRIGSRVNLERAMSAQGRFGGHIVQGHVDTPGRIRERYAEENAVVYRIEPSDISLFRYIMPQGSITVDGISLTVVDTDETTFSVSIIPHTLAQTILQDKSPGDTVNLECDVLGKYVERLLNFGSGGMAARSNRGSGKSGSITEAFLAEHGF